MARVCETGGWNQEKKKLRKATVVPNEDASARHFGEGRVSHLYTFCANSMLQPGQADSRAAQIAGSHNAVR